MDRIFRQATHKMMQTRIPSLNYSEVSRGTKLANESGARREPRMWKSGPRDQ